MHRAAAHLLALALAVPLSAQTIDLDVRGGSVPGQITWSLAGGTPFVQVGAIIVSPTSGPTSLSVLDPTDPRQLRVGFQTLALTQGGVFPQSAVIVIPTVPVPNQPALYGARLHMQGLSLPGTTTFVDRISQPRALRLAAANAFHDRGTIFNGQRSFFPVVPLGNGEHILLGGGQGALLAQIAQKSTSIYDPIDDTFRAGPDLVADRSLHTATLLKDGRWLIVGGVDRNNDPQATAEVFDPVALTSTAVASMATKRTGHSATRLPDGRVLVTGGLTNMNVSASQLDPIFSTTRSTELYDPVADQWSPGPILSAPRAGHAAFIVPGSGSAVRVVLAGGISWYTLPIINVKVPTIESSVDVFDSSTSAIGKGPALGTPRAMCSAVQLGSGDFLVAGGVAALTLTSPGTPTDTAEIYDVAAGAWKAAGKMAVARGLHQAFVLDGGKVIHIGGADGSITAPNPLASTSIYDPATGMWSAGPNMVASRAAYGAYATATGQVHVLGGDSAAVGVTNTNEFYYR